jgi:cellulose synthase/poly-beta-1,6-N-acetylglucosamine synthase-like glycosyltransferase
MDVSRFILFSIGSILAFLLAFPLLALLVSLLVPRRKLPKPGTETDFACVITAYQNIEIARQLVNSLLLQQYQNFRIYLVADNCPDFEMDAHSNLSIIRPSATLGSKVKSLLKGIAHFTRAHDAIIVFDPDNLAHPYYLAEMNRYFQAGFKVVQGQRVAKNTDTRYACMDALGEYFYNYSSRAVPFRLGASATISGSAMGVSMEVYQQYLDFMARDGINKVIVAEDKILQIYLVDNGYTIAYAEQAFVFDEKVSSGGQVARQRTRWLNAWFKHTKHGFATLFAGLTSFSFNKIYSGFLNVYPPMFLLVLASGITGFVSLFIAPEVSMMLLIGLFCFAANFFLSLKLNHTPKPVMQAFFSIPLFVFNQVLALLQVRKSDKDFMPTTHTRYISIAEVLKTTTHIYHPSNN